MSVPVSIERKKHMFPSKRRHIKHKLFFKGWALFRGKVKLYLDGKGQYVLWPRPKSALNISEV